MKKSAPFIILSASILFLAPNLGAQVAIVDTLPISVGVEGSSNAVATYATGYSVAETGNDNTLVVFYTSRGNSHNDVSVVSATFGGVDLSIAENNTLVNGQFRATTTIFYLNEADFGSISGSDLIVTRNAGDAGQGANFGLITLSGVDQLDTIGTTDSVGSTSTDNMSVTLSGLNDNNSLILSTISGSVDGAVAGGTNIDTIVGLGNASNGAFRLRTGIGATNVTGSSELVDWTYGGSRASLSAVEFIGATIPEPSTYALIIGASAMACLMIRRRKQVRTLHGQP